MQRSMSYEGEGHTCYQRSRSLRRICYCLDPPRCRNVSDYRKMTAADGNSCHQNLATTGRNIVRQQDATQSAYKAKRSQQTGQYIVSKQNTMSSAYRRNIVNIVLNTGGAYITWLLKFPDTVSEDKHEIRSIQSLRLFILFL